MTWQPIETAPADGTLIDLWIINYLGEGERLPHCKWDSWSYPSGEWVQQYAEASGAFFKAFDDREKATHWMPVPSPP